MARAPSIRESQMALFGIDPLELINTAVRAHDPIARVALLSGGDDSSVLTHWLWTHAHDGSILPADDRSLDPHRLLDFACHIDTGTGIQETRRFVYQFCLTYGIPLRVLHAPPGEYERAVLRWGFPGPAGHSIMYERLKERPLARLIAELKDGRGHRSQVLLYTGVRRAESRRRMGTTEAIQSRGGRLWVAPFIDRPKSELAAWREEHHVARSDVAALIHMSGECLCGAFGSADEMQDLRWAYPDAAANLDRLAARAEFYGVERSVWGAGSGEKAVAAGPMCSDCEHRQLAFNELERCVLAERPRVHVIQQRDGKIGEMAVRIHTPGREPGPIAVVAHGIRGLLIGASVRDQSGDRLADVAVDPDHGFVVVDEHPALQDLAGDWVGSTQTAVDIIVTAPKRERRSKRNADWPHGLLIYGMTSEHASPEFTPGPVRLGNYDRRAVFDRIRFIRGRVLIDEHPIGGWVPAPAGPTGRRGWSLEGVGRFEALLIIRRDDQAQVEADWEADGVRCGHVDVNTSTDWHQPLVTAARRDGLRQRVREALANTDPGDPYAFARALRLAVDDEGYRRAGCLIIHPDDRGQDWAKVSPLATAA